MTRDEQTWSILALLVFIALLVLWLSKKRTEAQASIPVTTQTSVTLQGTTTNFPTRTDNNEVQLRMCTYDSGSVITLNPLSVNGSSCPPYYQDVTGKEGKLVKDELITVPQAGQTAFDVTGGGGGSTPSPATDTNVDTSQPI